MGVSLHDASIAPQSLDIKLESPSCCGSCEASLAPIFDLAEGSDNPQLQAEAAVALLQATNDSELLAELCTPQAFIVFQHLLQLVCFSVVEPLSRLLCCLVMLPKANDNFINQELLHTMIEKVWAPSVGQHTSEQLAQAVSHAIAQHAAKFSHQTNRQLTIALTEKLSNGAPDFAASDPSGRNLVTTNCLQESLHNLRHFQPLGAAGLCY